MNDKLQSARMYPAYATRMASQLLRATGNAAAKLSALAVSRQRSPTAAGAASEEIGVAWRTETHGNGSTYKEYAFL